MVFMVKDFIFFKLDFLIGKLLKNICHDEFDGILDYRTYNKLLEM